MQFLLNRWIRIAAVVALTTFAGGAAMASSHRRRHHRHHRRHHTTHKQAPAPAKPVAKAPVKKVQERTGPASLKDIQRKSRGDRSLEAQADEKRDEEIKQLKKILPKITDPGQHADLLFQLAELWWEKSKYVYFREMDDWDKAYAKWMDATNHGSKAPQPKASHRESDIYRDQAVALYTRILHQYPNYPRADEVLFNLAYAMYDSGKQDQGVALYWELIKKYPTSGYVADAYLQMGEHFFNHNDVFKAQKAYQKALATGEKHVKNFAIYKLAWCDYNLGEYDSARKKFYTVIASAEKAERENPKLRGRIQLKEEALRDLVLTYSMLDQIQPAIDYYEQHAAKLATHLIGRLADAYFSAGKNQDAIQVYGWLIEHDPNGKQAPEYQAQIVKAYANLQQRDMVLKEMARLVDVYGPHGPWAEANKSDPDAVKSAYDLAESTQRELVTEYHQEAQKTKYAQTYRLAAKIYKQYLAKFSDNPHAYNLRFYYAEILFTLQDYARAAKQYLKVVHVDPDGKYSLTAAYDAILAYEKLAAIDRGDLKVQKATGKQKINEKKAKGAVTYKATFRKASKNDKAEAIPKWESKQIEAADAYVKIVRGWKAKHKAALTKKKRAELNDDEIVVRYKAAFLLYSHRHYNEAAKRFEHIILKWPDDKWANKAADLILDSLNTKEQWAELNKLAREFRKNRRLVRGGGKGFATRLDTLIEGSAFKMVLALNAAKKYDEAAPKFRAFVKEFPHSKYADKALYNAMVIFARAKTLDKAVTVGEQLLHSYGGSDLKPMVITSLGSYYEQMADYATAAKYYEAYADDYLDPKGKAFKALPQDMQEKVTKSLPDNLFNAALWYEGLGEDAKAVANYTRYVKTFPKRDDVPDIFYNVALIYQREKDWKREISQLQDYVKDYARRIKPADAYRAKFKVAQAYEKLGQPQDAAKVYADLAKHYAGLPKKAKQDSEVMDAAASAAFHLLEPEWQDYKAIHFDTSNARTLKKRLAEKTKALAKLEKDYTQVLTYGSGDWGIAALARIGMGYQDLAQNFLDAPTPKNLNADQQEMYKSVLQEKAFPLQDKAIEAFEKALAKSYELSVYNQWTLDAQNDLLKFKPDAYQAVHEVPYFGSEFFIVASPEKTLQETPKVVAPPPAPEPAASPAHANRQPSGDAQSAGRSS